MSDIWREERMLIDGRLVPATDGAAYDNINPATEEVIGCAADGGVADMAAVIAAARRAFDDTDRALAEREQRGARSTGRKGTSMVERSLAGKRVVVVGASAGIGRAFAVRAGKEGAQLVIAARRQDRLEEVAAEAGCGTAVMADVRGVDDCARIAEVARRALGRIDLLFISVGYAPLRMFADTTADDWFDVTQTNVVSVHQVIRACLPLLAPAAIVSAMSSETVGQPRTALGAYSASKAALAESLNAWRTEHPGFRFCCVAVGGTVPTDFTSAFDPALLAVAVQDWVARGLLQETLMAPDDVADVLAGVFASAAGFPNVGLEQLVLRPPSACRASL